MLDMYICICNGVTDREIREAVAAGADSVDALREELGVASCCGTCACAAQAILEGKEGETIAGTHSARSPAPQPTTLPASV
ncbi:MAG: bacterioferritin-associated ferredoxin [Pseudomonadota bacterium]